MGELRAECFVQETREFSESWSLGLPSEPLAAMGVKPHWWLGRKRGVPGPAEPTAYFPLLLACLFGSSTLVRDLTTLRSNSLT